MCLILIYSCILHLPYSIFVTTDDARSSKIEIVFETGAESKGLSGKKCTRILFKNNGFVFRPDDWNRLKKIAEGNPDEQKVNEAI